MMMAHDGLPREAGGEKRRLLEATRPSTLHRKVGVSSQIGMHQQQVVQPPAGAPKGGMPGEARRGISRALFGESSPTLRRVCAALLY